MKSSIRIAIAQVNPTVGDLAGNARMARRGIAEAKRLGAHIVAFPELMICGYPPEDLLLKPGFLADCETAVASVARAARGIAVLIGAPERPDAPGARPFNTCRVLQNGRQTASYRKLHLPNYGVFDERRYFDPGERAVVVRFGALPIGLQICEDIWAEEGPIGAQAGLGGARVVVNISASPYHRGKGKEREELMRRRARENGCWLVYANLVGGQDELVFDGSSVVVSPRGETIGRGTPFAEDLFAVDIDPDGGDAFRPAPIPRRGLPPVEMVDLPPLTAAARGPAGRGGAARPPRPKRHIAPHLDAIEEIYRALVLGTKDYVEKNGFSRVVLGLSGGIDSALVAAIAADALGPRRVVCVTMPSEFTSRATLRDARAVAENLGLRLFDIPIHGLYNAYLDSLRPVFGRRPMDAAEENIQARIRGTLVMALSNKFGWLVLTTGNKSELATGYCTLYGDMAGGFAIIKDVPKTLVYPLCRWRNARGRRPVIPQSILRRKPTAELRPGQTDQDTLPPYGILDRILELYVERDLDADDIVEAGCDGATVRRTIRMVDGSEYKRRQGAPGIKITPKAFGRDRRLPITNRYRGSDR